MATSAELVRAERCDEAIPLLDVLLSEYPLMQDYHLHHVATCATATADHARATEAWSGILRRHPRSIHAPAAALAWGLHLHGIGDDTPAEPLLLQVLASEDADHVNTARLALAEIDLARKNVRSAYTMFTSLREDAGRDVATRAKGYVMALRDRYPELAPTTSREREDEARLLLREGSHGDAMRLTNGILASVSRDNQPHLLLLRAHIERADGHAQKYLATIRDIHTTYPKSPQASVAIFDEARWLWNKDSDRTAKKVFLEIERRFPRHRRIATVRYALGRIAQDAGHRRTALTRFRSVVKHHSRTGLARQARWQMAWLYYYAKDYRSAARELNQLGRGRSAKTATDTTYWRGRTLEAEGRRVEAHALFESIVEQAPDSYYAARAATRLGTPSRFSTSGTVARTSLFPKVPTNLEGDYHLIRAQHLHKARLMRFARNEVGAFSRSTRKQDRDFMIDLHRAVDGHRQAIRLSGHDRDRYADVHHPLAFWNLVTANAQRFGIDPFLALSLMRQESLFDPEALSPANARGLMQLLPSTAREVAERIGRSGDIDLYDPATNIELGVAHLRELADRYNEDHVRILAAYNAGATAVAKWDDRFGDRASDEYVESITYSETRNYVKKVLGNYRRYQRLYGSPTSTVNDAVAPPQV